MVGPETTFLAISVLTDITSQHHPTRRELLQCIEQLPGKTKDLFN